MESTDTSLLAQFIALKNNAIGNKKHETHTEPFQFNGHVYYCRHEYVPEFKLGWVWSTILIN